MAAEWIIALIAGLVAVGGLIAWGAALTFQMGRHAEKVTNVKTEVDQLKVKTDSHASALSALQQLPSMVKEVRDDIKTLMMGRPQASAPRRRKTGEN